MGVNAQPYTVLTTNATATIATQDAIEQDTLTGFDITVLATDTNSNVLYVNKRAVVKRIGTNPPVLVGQLDLFNGIRSIGALLWSVTLSVDSGMTFYVTIQGAASTSIKWFVQTVGTQSQL